MGSMTAVSAATTAWICSILCCTTAPVLAQTQSKELLKSIDTPTLRHYQLHFLYSWPVSLFTACPIHFLQLARFTFYSCTSLFTADQIHFLQPQTLCERVVTLHEEAQNQHKSSTPVTTEHRPRAALPTASSIIQRIRTVYLLQT